MTQDLAYKETFNCEDAGLAFCAMDWDSLPEGWSCRTYLFGEAAVLIEFLAPNGQVFSAFLYEKEN